MKKILSLILSLSLVVPMTLSVAFAQQSGQDQFSCLQNYNNNNLKSNGTYQYYVDAAGGRYYYWVSPQPQAYYIKNTGEYGTWNCQTAGNNLTLSKTGTLPACIQKLSTLTTTVDPNTFLYNDRDYKDVLLSIKDGTYDIRRTAQTGKWVCNSDNTMTLLGAKVPPKDNSQDTSTGTTDNSQDTSSGAKNTPNAQTITDAPLKIKLNNPLCSNPDDPTKKCTRDIQDAIKLFMDAVVKIAIPFIVVFFIWSGLQFILARGNAKKIEDAKRMFWYTVIGTLLILGAWAITDAIVGTVNSLVS